MLTYVTLYRYTSQGIQNVKGSPRRIADAKNAIARAGGKVKGIYVTMGQYDLVAVSEWPDEATGAAFTLAQAAMGNVTTETLRAFTEAEFEKIVAAMP
jgi:uncharacterized protein with GYD domain